MQTNEIRPGSAAPWARVLVLTSALLAAGYLSVRITGSVVPTTPQASAVFQSGLLLVVLGSTVLEHKFTRPADSVVNGLTGMITLITVYHVAPRTSWYMVFGFCAVVFSASLLCTVVSSGPEISGWRRQVAELTYQPAVVLGRARVLHSIVFLFAVLSYYGSDAQETRLLISFWGIFLALWPLQIPQLLSNFTRRDRSPEAIGRVARRDWPNLLRIELIPSIPWDQSNVRIYQDGDGVQHLVVPLYKQLKDEQAIATGLCVPYEGPILGGLSGGFIYDFSPQSAPTPDDVAQSLGATDGSELLGFVVEDSRIGAITFETWRQDVCREGLLVWCAVADMKVFYQITEGSTREEALQTDRLGYQCATAAQIGVLNPSDGFTKCDWLPTMNTPVFSESVNFGTGMRIGEKKDFTYGVVPGTKLAVSGPFTSTMDFHTAILGVTGSGKTELAFDLIRHSLAQGMKVVCIDLTARYEGRLTDLKPVNLSISTENSRDLGERIFAVETGEFKAGTEKKALKDLHSVLHADVSRKLADFLGGDGADNLALITLDEISNTKASLFITELYMTCLLHFARDNPTDCPRVLVVVEEAHTVMPEPSTMGLGDYDSRGLVAKISQLALQGRKYGVGLLVIAQRTATVSKNVLTQCNTVIALSCFDETTTGFLANVFGRAHAEAVRDLPYLHAVVFGKGVRSQRPVIVEIPFVADKVGA